MISNLSPSARTRTFLQHTTAKRISSYLTVHVRKRNCPTQRSSKSAAPCNKINSRHRRLTRTFIIARQHGYACRARYCHFKSVRPSLRHTLLLYRNECTCRQTLSTAWYRCMTSFFSATSPLQNSKGTSLSKGVKYTYGVGKFCDFRQ